MYNSSLVLTSYPNSITLTLTQELIQDKSFILESNFDWLQGVC